MGTALLVGLSSSSLRLILERSPFAIFFLFTAMNFRTRLNYRRCTELGQGLNCQSTGLQQLPMALLDSDSWSYPGCIHVVVMPAGKQAGDAQCARVLRALRDVPPVQFKDAVIFPRFMKQEGMPKWVEHHLRWEELAAYKQVLGVLGVACCADRGELEEAEAAMSQSSASFRRTACCTKYLLLGPKEQLESLVAEREDLYLLGGPDEPLDAKVLEKAVGDMAWCVANTLHQNIRAASRPDSVKVFRSQFDLNNPSAEEEIK